MSTKTAHKSFRYKANTAWSSARRGTLSASGKPNIDVGSPPEFKGEPDIWAPERAIRGLGQHMHDADLPHARPSERSDSVAI